LVCPNSSTLRACPTHTSCSSSRVISSGIGTVYLTTSSASAASRAGNTACNESNRAISHSCSAIITSDLTIYIDGAINGRSAKHSDHEWIRTHGNKRVASSKIKRLEAVGCFYIGIRGDIEPDNCQASPRIGHPTPIRKISVAAITKVKWITIWGQWRYANLNPTVGNIPKAGGICGIEMRWIRKIKGQRIRLQRRTQEKS
jgi:hypothetical protein